MALGAPAWGQRFDQPLPPTLGAPPDSALPPSVPTTPAMPELIVDLSSPRVSITSAFQGESLLLFGMFDPPGEIVVVVQGPAARETYFVAHDPATLAVDVAATEAARAAERQARLRRGRPYEEFVKLWATPEPPAHLPYYGSWGDDNSVVHATAWSTHGPVRVAGPVSRLPQIFLPDPNVIALAGQQARIAELEARVHELEDQ